MNAPEVIEQQAKARKTAQEADRGREIDDPGRRSPRAGGNRPGSRSIPHGQPPQCLGGILRVLIATDFDGFMSTPDMIEDLLIMDYLVQDRRGAILPG